MPTPPILFYTAFALYTLVLFISTCLFFYYRRIPSVRHRSPPFTLLTVLANFALSALFLLRQPVYDQFPCYISYWVVSLFAPMAVIALCARFIRLALLYRVSEAALTRRYWLNDAAANAEQRLLQRKLVPGWLLRHHWYWRTSRLLIYTALFFVVYFFILMAIQVTDPQLAMPIGGVFLQAPHPECNFGVQYLPLYIVQIGLMFVLCPTLLFVLQDVQDSYGIKFELHVTMAAWMISAVLFFIWGLGELGIMGTMVPNWTWVFLCLVFCHYVGVILPVWRAFRSSRSDVFDLEQGSVPNVLSRTAFNLVLSDPLLFNDLKKFTVSDFSVENALFVDHLQKLSLNAPTDLDVYHSHQKQIYALFLAPDAELQLNINASTRVAIEQRLNQYPPDELLFVDALQEIRNLMFRDTFPRFVRAGGDHRRVEIARLLNRLSKKSLPSIKPSLERLFASRSATNVGSNPLRTWIRSNSCPAAHPSMSGVLHF